MTGDFAYLPAAPGAFLYIQPLIEALDEDIVGPLGVED